MTMPVGIPGPRPARSLGLGVLRLIVGITYVIYIAVSFFHSENFLFGLDALLATAFIFAITSRSFARRTAGQGYLLLLLAVYAACVLYAWVGKSAMSDMATLKTARNLLYCVAVFIVTLTYITTRERLKDLIKMMAMLTVLSAFYGLRQAIFGYWGFELERLALMGSSLAELLILGRARLTATFGDPLLCGFFMMTGLFVIRVRWALPMRSNGVRRFYAIGAAATFIVLIASLTRAPLLAFGVGSAAAIAIDFQFTRRSVGRIGWAVLGVGLFVGLVVWLFESGVLIDSTNPVLHFLDASISSVWSLVALFFGGGNEDNYFLVSQSKDMRALAWGQGMAFLASNPLGAGFSYGDRFSFAIGDTGLLQVALLIGVPGAFAYLALITHVLLKGWAQVRRAKRVDDRRIIAALFGLWIAFIVTTSISSLATTSVASVIMWLVAAALVNARVIFRDPSPAEAAVPDSRV